MAYRAAGHRANDKSPSGVENGGRGPNLTVNTNIPTNGRLNGEASAFRPNKFLLHDSTPDHPVIVSSERNGVHGSSSKKTVPTPIGQSNGISPTRVSVTYTTDVVTNHQKFRGSHYVEVKVDADQYVHLFEQLNKNWGFHSWIRDSVAKSEPDSKRLTLCICFDDTRRASEALEKMQTVITTVDFEYVSQPQFASAKKVSEAKKAPDGEVTPPTAFYDGQVMFYAKFSGRFSSCKPDELEGQIYELARSVGDDISTRGTGDHILALGELDAKDGMARFRVEYFSIKVAKAAIKKFAATSPVDLNGWDVYAQELPDLAGASGSDSGTVVAGRATPLGSANGDVANSWCSPTGRTGWVTDMQTGEKVPSNKVGGNRHSPVNGGEVALWSGRVNSPAAVGFGALSNGRPRHGPLSLPPMTPASWGFNNTPNQMIPYNEPLGRVRSEHPDSSQVVDPDLISQGLDVRTTLMLRNLPNQMTCHVLKALLDRSNFGGYDFSYVRIDYEKGASVGYGFVNFTSPEEIIKFLDAHIGHPWMPALPSRKGAARLAEVSYATVQGYDCCIEKFRNSSVMTEYIDYRPKLWYSKTSAPSEDMIGKEADFPCVNNPSKHQRSLANATQIGLFPPQSRRGPGGTHRPGRSQFDRGTTAQQQEDMIFHMQNQMQRMNFAHPGPFGPGQMPMPYPMPPMPPMQMLPMMPHYPAPFAPGNPMYANQGALMAPPGYYPQPPMPMTPVSPQYINGHGFANHMAAGPQFNGNMQQNGHRAGNVPRTFTELNETESDPKAAGGNVNGGASQGASKARADEAKAAKEGGEKE